MMTSWPGPTSSVRRASSRAALPELTAAAAVTPRYRASSRSSPATSGPWARCPPRTTRATRWASSSPMVGREWGIIVTGTSRSAPSEIQEQPDRLERLRVLDPGLNAPEVRARSRQLEDRQILDVGLRHLRPVRLEARELRVEHLGDVRGAVWDEVHRRRHLVEEEVGHVARCRHRALGQVAMILVGVVGRVDEDHPRLDLSYDGLDPHDQLPRERHLGVPVVAPEDLAHPEDARRVLLLPPTHLGIAAERAVGGDEHVNGVAPLRILGQHAAAAVLDVVGMRAEGENVHLVRLGREAGPRASPTENAEGLIAVHQ